MEQREVLTVHALSVLSWDGQFDEPVDVTFFNDDEILVTDECNHRIQQLNVQTGNFMKKFGKTNLFRIS